MNLLRKQIILFLSAVIVLFAGLSVFASDSSSSPNPFSFISGKCNIIGAINLDKVKKIKGVEDAISKTQNDPMYQCLKLSGLTADNIDEIFFGMYVDKVDQNITPSFVSLLKTEKTYNLDKFLAKSKDLNDVKITSDKYKNDNVYKFISTNINEKQEPIYFAKINDNILAIGTKDYVEKSIDLVEGKNDSVLSNKDLMQLSNKAEKNDMLWIAADLPKLATEVTAKSGVQQNKIPNINSGIIALNYIDNNLKVTGQINCATKEDVQKVLLPVQMFMGIFAMNPDNGISPQDIKLTPKDTKIDINIKIPEKAINNIVNSQTQQQAGTIEQAAVNTEQETTATAENNNQQPATVQ